MQIVHGAQQFMRDNGVDQWQDGYPDVRVMQKDMEDHTGYVWVDDAGHITGIITIIPGHEPSYDVIYDGAWQTGEPYASIHRVAVDSQCRTRGTAVAMMKAAEAVVVQHGGMQGIRIDTHEDNISMRKMLTKCGYTHCGTIYLVEEGAPRTVPRIAFEKPIHD